MGLRFVIWWAERKKTYFTSSFTSYLHLSHYPPWLLLKSWHGWLEIWNANWRAALSGCIKEGGSYSLEHLLGLGKEKKQIGTIILCLTQLLALWLDTCSDGDHCIHLKQSLACNGHMVIAIEWEVTLDYRHPLKEILDKKTPLSGPTSQKLTTNHCFQCVLHLITFMMRERFFSFQKWAL